MRRTLILILLSLRLASALSQISITLNPQQQFKETIPAGNYSGIAWLGGTRYAVVSDKSEHDGYYVFDIQLDTITGAILSAKTLGFYGSERPGRDDEDIAYLPDRCTLMISGETDNHIIEFDQQGRYTGRATAWPDSLGNLPENEGLEALTYCKESHHLWTCNETAPIRLLEIDSIMKVCRVIPYRMDSASISPREGAFYTFGVPSLCALNADSLLVLEREAYVPKMKLGAFVKCKLFCYNILTYEKTLLAQWQTYMKLFDHSFANYEGMCIGPMLAGGKRALVMVADSQNQYAGVLRDWLKTAVLIKSVATGYPQSNK
ncbi:esterase-like activity of phytase family protein [Hallella absiana]|uniref:esterase-like activity of phytase family protein n=1 Tax=Hallella absiana TaxID=2925336 RepID=UPI0021CAD808|nr:esterase-like activity of phytase family protein [Hallella absiana]